MKDIVRKLAGPVIGALLGHFYGWFLLFFMYNNNSEVYFGVKTQGFTELIIILGIFTVAGGVSGWVAANFNE